MFGFAFEDVLVMLIIWILYLGAKRLPDLGKELTADRPDASKPDKTRDEF
ncbi:MAG: hypothetical protein WCG06_05655 [Candidatus Omnitrophota bacterium]